MPRVLLLSLAAALVFDAHPAQAKVNAAAAAIAKQLKPAKLRGKVGEGDLESVSDRVIKIIEVLEKTKRSSGPPPRDL
ncbi:MAG: hypothetical protein ACC661_05640, partial [Verrucomicrobiales bacterium]